MKNKLLISLFAATALFACNTAKKNETLTESGLNPAKFETVIDSVKTGLFVLKNKNNMEVCITNFGGRIISVMVPDKDGVMKDVVLGFPSIQDYINNPSNFGATIGRYANRINNGEFTLDGIKYQLPQNNYGHCLHGGLKGFQDVMFLVDEFKDNHIKLSYLAKNGEEGFPGNINCSVTITLTDDNALKLDYEAKSDKATIINMTNHSYFNLDGDPSKDNSEYLLTINADSFTPVDSTFMTTGEIASVNMTPMDFREPTKLGDIIDLDNEQIKNGHGIDHNWVLNTNGDINKVCASLKSNKTGIKLDVYTTEPGIQIYTGNFLNGTQTGKNNIVYNHRASVCLETQKYPDTPNKPQWPSCVLRPGEKYSSQTIFKFSVEK